MVYILGGFQSDFSRNWAREGHTLFDMFSDTVQRGLDATGINAGDIGVGHVGNFVSDAFTHQAHLGGFFGHVHPDMAYMPASSHEAACASGSMAIQAAMADIESGRYDTACVLGIEMMRNVSGGEAAENLRPAAWVDKEWEKARFVWPCAFDAILKIYQERYGLQKSALEAISQKNFANAKNNPNAQTRSWSFNDKSFTEDDTENPRISGDIRRQDCGQTTDGAAVAFLANEEVAREYAKQHGCSLQDIPRIKGWAHVNAPMQFEEKIKLAEGNDYVFPHVRKLFDQALARAGFSSIGQIDGLEVHDCFNITEYMILDHVGVLPPGEAWKAIEDGVTQKTGSLPINASGGLIGAGHPVGATGVRMLLDCFKQVKGVAGDYQIEGAKNMMTFNLGGSTTTNASFVVGCDR